MSNAARIPLAEAREIAQRLVIELFPSCTRIVVAGSIRRERPDIGDIDLVCEPVTEDAVDMFGLPTGGTNDCLHDRCNELLESGVLTQRLDRNGRPAWGHGLKRAVYEGLNADIQAVRDASAWGFWLLIRTGPAEFNKQMVTPRHRGGLLPPGMEVRGGFHLYRSGGLIPTPSELDVFTAYGLPWIEPRDRGAASDAPALTARVDRMIASCERQSDAIKALLEQQP